MTRFVQGPSVRSFPPDFFEALVEEAPDAVLVVDEAGRIILANRQCDAVLGWSPADLVGRPVEVLLPPTLKSTHVGHRAAYLAEPQARTMAAGMALTAMRPDGTEVPVDVALSPIPTSEGVVVKASIRDATFRRQMEQEMQASEQRWKTSLASMLDAFAIFRCLREQGEIVDFEVVYVNEAAAATYKRPADDLIGAKIRDLVPGFESSARFDDYKRVVEYDKPLTNLDYRYAGDVISGVFDLQAWKLDDGFAATWRDVSDREASAAALQASEERFRTCVEDLRDAMSIFTAVRDDSGEIVDFRWEYANTTAGVMTGYSPAELAGRLLLEVLPDHGPSGMLDVYKGVVETGEPYIEPSLWYEDVWGDGRRRRRAFDVRATKLQDGFVVVTREVTTVREQQEAIARQQAELERSNREIRLLNDLAEFLQGCLTLEEAYSVVAASSELLFPGFSGSLSILQPSRDILESSATWGDIAVGQTLFAPAECWALRRGRSYRSDDRGPRCAHLRGSSAA